MKNLSITSVFLFLSLSLFAQTVQTTNPKTGYTNVEFLLSKLPDLKKISLELENQKKQYETVYQQKVKDFQEKMASYQKNGAGLPEIIRKDKEKELQTLQASIEELQQNIEKDLYKKQDELVQPLYTKVYAAIQAVAEENGYKFIFNTGSSTARNLIVAPVDGDLSEMILKKLGATAKEEKKIEEKVNNVVNTTTKSQPSSSGVEEAKKTSAKPTTTTKPKKK